MIDIFSKYPWVVPLKDKNITIVDAFQKILNDLKRKPNQIWLEKKMNFITDQWNHGYKKIV